MTNWLERAKRQLASVDMHESSQLSLTRDRATAKTDGRNLTAVTAVPKPHVSSNSGVSNVSNGGTRVSSSPEICTPVNARLAIGTTAKTDERHLTAVTAVPESRNSQNSGVSNVSSGSALRAPTPEICASINTALHMTAAEELVIRLWLADIGETDPEDVKIVVDKCNLNVEAREYFLDHAFIDLRIRLSRDIDKTPPIRESLSDSEIINNYLIPA
jgi:hypothetical protein